MEEQPLHVLRRMHEDKDYDGMVHPVDDEDYAAALWVREHGGLYAVRERLGERKMLVDRLHAYEDALDMMADSIGVEKSSDKIAQARRTRKAVKSLERRPMPEGMEWPRYEDGEPVRIGGEFMGKDGKTYTANQIQFIGKCFSLYDFCDRKPQFNGFYGELVKRPAVIAADGEPLEVGQTVWEVDGTGHPFKVVSIRTSAGRAMEPTVVTCDVGDGTSEHFLPSQLTHERPDSLERIADEIDRLREDVAQHLGDYLYDEDRNDSIQFSMELVAKRCRALAERERGEE